MRNFRSGFKNEDAWEEIFFNISYDLDKGDNVNELWAKLYAMQSFIHRELVEKRIDAVVSGQVIRADESSFRYVLGVRFDKKLFTTSPTGHEIIRALIKKNSIKFRLKSLDLI